MKMYGRRECTFLKVWGGSNFVILSVSKENAKKGYFQDRKGFFPKTLGRYDDPWKKKTKNKKINTHL